MEKPRMQGIGYYPEDLFRAIDDIDLLPSCSYTGSHWDLKSAENLVLNPGEYTPVRTGIVLQPTISGSALICPRSGLASKYGITVLNAPGVIDEGYTGEIKVVLINHGTNWLKINKYDRIAQIVFIQSHFMGIGERPEDRGESGFGSSGV